jgi:hypothetical protein
MEKTIRAGKGIMMDVVLMPGIGAVANEECNGNFSRAVETLCQEALQAREAAKAAELS